MRSAQFTPLQASDRVVRVTLSYFLDHSGGIAIWKNMSRGTSDQQFSSALSHKKKKKNWDRAKIDFVITVILKVSRVQKVTGFTYKVAIIINAMF